MVSGESVVRILLEGGFDARTRRRGADGDAVAAVAVGGVVANGRSSVGAAFVRV